MSMGPGCNVAGVIAARVIDSPLFSLIHNPCSTTIYTIWKETRSLKWTLLSALLPLVMGFAVCFLVAQFWRMLA